MNLSFSIAGSLYQPCYTRLSHIHVTNVVVVLLHVISQVILFVLNVAVFPIHREEGGDFDYKKMTLDILPNFLQLLPKITIQRAGIANYSHYVVLAHTHCTRILISIYTAFHGMVRYGTCLYLPFYTIPNWAVPGLFLYSSPCKLGAYNIAFSKCKGVSCCDTIVFVLCIVDKTVVVNVMCQCIVLYCAVVLEYSLYSE